MAGQVQLRPKGENITWSAEAAIWSPRSQITEPVIESVSARPRRVPTGPSRFASRAARRPSSWCCSHIVAWGRVVSVISAAYEKAMRLAIGNIPDEVTVMSIPMADTVSVSVNGYAELARREATRCLPTHIGTCGCV